jgi:tRNA 2-thiouridine synthesizing protein A
MLKDNPKGLSHFTLGGYGRCRVAYSYNATQVMCGYALFFGSSFKSLVGEEIMNFDKELNARGLSCPLPIVKTKKALADMTPNQILKVISTDCGSVKDMAAFAEQTGNPLVSQEEVNGEYVFYMKKK